MNNIDFELYLNLPYEKFLIGWETIHSKNPRMPKYEIHIHIVCFTLKFIIT